MSDEKMREEFRSWFATHAPRCNAQAEAGSEHKIAIRGLAECAWQASRAAIEVEFPYVPQLFSGSDDFNDGVSACKEVIESLGLKVKP